MRYKVCILHCAVESGIWYEVYVNSDMPDTSRNRRRLIRFIAQEVTRDMGTNREIPHFDKSAVSIILREAQRRAGREETISSPQRASVD